RRTTRPVARLQRHHQIVVVRVVDLSRALFYALEREAELVVECDGRHVRREDLELDTLHPCRESGFDGRAGEPLTNSAAAVPRHESHAELPAVPESFSPITHDVAPS